VAGRIELDGFEVTTRREPDGRWRGVIRKVGGSTLVVTLPGKHAPRRSLITEPPQYNEKAAIADAIKAIKGGNIK
jgi:hypothetical protein